MKKTDCFDEEKQIEDRYYELIKKAKEYMTNIKDNEHNLSHINDVVLYVKKLISIIDFDVNKEACIISAYWHDVGRIYSDSEHEKISAEMLKKYMTKMNCDKELIHKCCSAIENHKWNMIPTTNEGLILKDADKLAFLGKGRWKSCLDNNQSLDSIMEILPVLRNEVLYFDESRKIYDREIINLLKLLYKKIYITKASNMAKDMYQKRKDRKEQRENNQDNGATKTNINCSITIN